MDETPEEIEAHNERLIAWREELKRDRVHMQNENASMARIAVTRITKGHDTLEAYRTRVADITSRPTAEPHTIWNAQNFLEQVEAAMEAKEAIQELRNTPTSEAASRDECIEILRRFEAGHKDTTEPHE